MIYFASDFHLGADIGGTTSREREKTICRWLDTIKEDAERIFLVGDVFDFWFEFKHVIPKGYVRILGKLAELRDAGIPIEFFIGNHDMWMFKYFETELGIPIHKHPVIREYGGKKMMIGHGDGLGPGDTKYKILKKVFRNPIAQRLFAATHPAIGFGIAQAWSESSRRKKGDGEREFLGEKGEWLIAYCNRKIETTQVDYFVFGHRHLPIDYLLKDGKTRYINLGEWMMVNSYAVFDGNDMQVKFFENPDGVVFNNQSPIKKE